MAAALPKKNLNQKQFQGFIPTGSGSRGGEDPDHGATLVAKVSTHKVPKEKLGNEALDKLYKG
jgi:hypothetical protein